MASAHCVGVDVPSGNSSDAATAITAGIVWVRSALGRVFKAHTLLNESRAHVLWQAVQE
jgi:hypothetical protein